MTEVQKQKILDALADLERAVDDNIYADMFEEIRGILERCAVGVEHGQA